MRLTIDPGHGMSNRVQNRFDTGAVHGTVREADIVLDFALELRRQAVAAGHQVSMTRASHSEHRSLFDRPRFARQHHADLMISLHCNAATDEHANGIETLYRASDAWARRLQPAVVHALALRDRGVKQRTDLLVLTYPESVIVELGFISNATDRAVLTGPLAPQLVARAIVGVL